MTQRIILAIHEEAIAQFGGLSGTRDGKLLESALNRPLNTSTYSENVSLFELAATLCHGLIKNHPFNDGNKRTGLLSAHAFLFLNGHALEPDEFEEVEMMVGVADGSIDETALAAWLEANSKPID